MTTVGRTAAVRDEAGASLPAAEDRPPALFPEALESFPKRVGRPEEPRADEFLDGPAHRRRGGAGVGQVVQGLAGADDPEIAVEDDEDPAERLEDRFQRPETGAGGTGASWVGRVSGTGVIS